MEKKYKILIIEPSLPFGMDNRPFKKRNIHYFSLSAIQVASYFPDYYDIKYINEVIDDIPYTEDFDGVFITTMGPSLIRAFEISKIFIDRGIPVIAGGTGVLIFPEESYDKFNSIAIGECESYINELIADFENGILKKEYISTKNYDLSTVKQPRYDLLNHKKHKTFYPVQATRGCTNTCSFCYLSIQNEKYRKKPIENVIKDIETIKSYGINSIVFMDENLCCDKGYAIELLKTIKKLNVHWIAHIDIRFVFDDEFLNLAKESGCLSLIIGFESINTLNLESVNKKTNLKKDYYDAINRAHSKGISVVGNFIVGMEEDTPETFMELALFGVDSRIDFFMLTILSPLYGTDLYKQMKEENRLIDYAIKKATGTFSLIKMPNMKHEEIEKYYYKILKKVFSPLSIIKRTIFNKSKISITNRIINLIANFIVKKNIKNGIFSGVL